jgi:serine phosphatase RsbU (regulator of sigma subunit)
MSMAQLQQITKARSRQMVDRYTDLFLAFCFLGGIALAPYYDTWVVGFVVGGVLLFCYYTVKLMLPASSLYEYVLGAIIGVFMAQYIHQMHGMFEMHFFAFIGSTYLVVYQNWKLQIPLAVVVLLHHALFAWLQFSGTEGVYFTELDHMPLTTLFIHLFLATSIFLLSAFWAYTFHRSRQALVKQSVHIGQLREANRQSAALLRMKSDLRDLHERNKEVTDSIRYTQRLQQALLPEVGQLQHYFAGSFVFDRPHSIVGGDFLWLRQLGREMVVACVDCTGHGVPGAFMTIVATDLLNRIVREHPDQSPGIMLEMLDAELTQSIGLEKTHGVADGMDIALCRIDLRTRTLYFAGANNAIVLASALGTRMFKGERHCVGGHITPGRKEFKTHEIKFEEGEMLYMFSDGFADQFGGRRDKKFTRNGLITLVEKIQALPIEEQHAKVSIAFDAWKGGQAQTDDTILVGVELRSNLSVASSQKEVVTTETRAA